MSDHEESYAERIIEGVDISKFIQKEFVDKPRMEREFFESGEFNTLYDLINGAESVDEMGLAYETQKVEGLTRESFAKFCNSIYTVLGEEVVCDVSSSVCSRDHLDYKALRIHLTLGQGGWYSSSRKES